MSFIGMRNDYLLQDCQYGGFKKSFPDLDYALMGYNVLKGYPLAAGHDPGFTHPIFKVNPFIMVSFDFFIFRLWYCDVLMIRKHWLLCT